ncbi:hypothetical protein [Leifsonia sp. NPDC058248]|uniref:hypothetical protein n=1 Tax=Leifsonia sp. NPDC058248 TaxID=3346402 RepID=UPI0036DE40C8
MSDTKPSGGSADRRTVAGAFREIDRLVAIHERIAAENERISEENAQMRIENERIRNEHEQMRRDYDSRQREFDERQKDLFLVSGIDAISNVLENGFDTVIGQLQPLADLVPSNGEVPLPDDVAERFVLLQQTMQRIRANSYEVSLVEYDVGFLNDPPPAIVVGVPTSSLS